MYKNKRHCLYGPPHYHPTPPPTPMSSDKGKGCVGRSCQPPRADEDEGSIVFAGTGSEWVQAVYFHNFMYLHLVLVLTVMYCFFTRTRLIHQPPHYLLYLPIALYKPTTSSTKQKPTFNQQHKGLVEFIVSPTNSFKDFIPKTRSIYISRLSVRLTYILPSPKTITT